MTLFVERLESKESRESLPISLVENTEVIKKLNWIFMWFSWTEVLDAVSVWIDVPLVDLIWTRSQWDSLQRGWSRWVESQHLQLWCHGALFSLRALFASDGEMWYHINKETGMFFGSGRLLWGENRVWRILNFSISDIYAATFTCVPELWSSDQRIRPQTPVDKKLFQGLPELRTDRNQMSELQDLMGGPADYIFHLVWEHKHEMSIDWSKCFPSVEIDLESFGKCWWVTYCHVFCV